MFSSLLYMNTKLNFRFNYFQLKYIMSSAVSRVLSWVIIYLILLLPTGLSDLPESTTGRRIAFCSVLLRMGFTCAFAVTGKAVGSYPAFPPLPAVGGRFISVALAWESPPPDVIRHPALRSPDFPHLLSFDIAAAITRAAQYNPLYNKKQNFYSHRLYDT